MAGSSLFALLDDIATLLDDVSVLSKAAAKKTAGVLGDDLALNAEQVSGIRASRELPVVWAVFKGSAINKAIMVPIALLLSAFLPWAIMPLLMLGGAYLCFEGSEKVIHRFLHPSEKEDEHKQRLQAIAEGHSFLEVFPNPDTVNFRLSPDGKRLVGGVSDFRTGLADIWLFDLERKTQRRLTQDSRWENAPIWNREGTRVYFASDRDGYPDVYRLSVDESAPPEVI